MRQSLLYSAVLAALLASNVAMADEAAPAEAAAPAAAEPASPWTATANISYVTNYVSRGVSQSWNMPAVQGGFDISHSSGFYAGLWSSSVSERTYVGVSQEIDIYGGYNGTISAVEGLGWSAGVAGYYYPGGSWGKYDALTGVQGKKIRNSFNTWEANVGLSYKWISGKISYTLTDWFGADKSTGWSKSTDGSMYYELNANVPLPIWSLNLIGHVGYSDIQGRLSTDPFFANANGSTIVETSADSTDYKIGLTKAFKIAQSEGWNTGLFYTYNDNSGDNGYWGRRGYGGGSFTTKPGAKDLGDGTFVFTFGRTF